MIFIFAKIWFLSLIFCAQSAFAEIKVAFFIARDAAGKIVQLEKGGRFYHVAISYQERWLHVNYSKGVHLVDELSEIGEVGAILVNSKIKDLTDSDIKPYIGLPYDRFYVWDNISGTYCSKLIINLLKELNIQPEPMVFNTPIWQNKPMPVYQRGASPDDLYQALKKRQFIESALPKCGQVYTRNLQIELDL